MERYEKTCYLYNSPNIENEQFGTGTVQEANW